MRHTACDFLKISIYSHFQPNCIQSEKSNDLLAKAEQFLLVIIIAIQNKYGGKCTCSHGIFLKQKYFFQDIKKNRETAKICELHYTYNYTGDFFALLKSLQRKRRNCERTITIILTVYMLKLKDFVINFSFQQSTETIVNQKTLFGIFFSNFIVVLCNNILKKFQI